MIERITAACALGLVLAACHRAPLPVVPSTPARGVAVAARDTSVADYFEAAGVANPIEQATLSTRLLATVLGVTVVEGARVSAGEVLMRLDAADLAARRRQASATADDASMQHGLAQLTADRMRAMYADSAAPRAQLDAAETSLARASAALVAAREAITEVDAMARYAEIRAPFAGVVTRRFVDPGAFAAPGTPLLTVEANDRLRISVTIPASLASGLRPGRRLAVRLEGEMADAVIEGVVPASGNLYTINALVENRGGAHLSGGAATLLVPQGARHAILVPVAALLRQGDQVGVRRRFAAGDAVTWVRIGATVGREIEILSGLAAGDSVIVPSGSR